MSASSLPAGRRWPRVLLSALLATAALAACSFPEFLVLVPADAAGGEGGGEGGEAACETALCMTCTPETADCNGEPDDGCEASLQTAEHCGACERACTNDHGSTSCVVVEAEGLQCVPVCAPGYADCDLDPDAGCETNLNTDVLSCGACGKACPSSGGTPTCVAGECGVSSCNEGFGDCDNAGACTFNLSKDTLNCGSCGNVCSSAHGVARCTAGRCEIECEAGFGDCNGPEANDGCETTLNVRDDGGNVPHCGACGALCKRRAFTSINLEQCAAGVCFRDCLSGAQDCGNNRNDPTCVGGSCGCEYGACE